VAVYWSGPSPVFDLEVPYLRRWLYQIVLREASRPEDLTGYLDRDTGRSCTCPARCGRRGRSIIRSCGPLWPGRPDAGQ